MRRVVAVALLAGAVLVAAASGADAHALVRSSDPSNGAILAQPPTQVTITFTDSGRCLIVATTSSVSIQPHVQR